MTKGILQVEGTLSLSQFWPEGKSDADTSHIQVEVRDFTFQVGDEASRKISFFEKAIVYGRIKKPVCTKGKITVRLQGIDAPELHYRPQSSLPAHLRSEEQTRLFLLWNYDYRQPLGETSTIKLRQLLESAKREQVPCRIATQVEEPGEAFDCYGRLVGDIWVSLKKREVNLNHWLLQNGWAFPAFYDSMTRAEIHLLSGFSLQAQKRKLGVWAQWSEHIQQFNWSLRFRKEPFREPGHLRLVLPKLFRRQASWAVNERAGLFHGGFREYLKAHPDRCYLTHDFLKNGQAATVRRLEEFLLPHGFFATSPQGLVFREAPAQLKGDNGETLSGWDYPKSKEAAMSKKKEVQAPTPAPKPTPPKPEPLPVPVPKPTPKPPSPNPGPTDPTPR